MLDGLEEDGADFEAGLSPQAESARAATAISNAFFMDRYPYAWLEGAGVRILEEFI